MGQRYSNLTNLDQDLKKIENSCFEKNIILLTLIPVYIIDNDEFESNLSTGNEKLDNLVDQRINKVGKYIGDLLANKLKYDIRVTETHNQKIYLTFEKCQKSPFEIEDCKQIRQFFDDYNFDETKLTIINENEANQSPFYEDVGEIKLGFKVDPIEYM